jgi:hypothetical protein
MSRLVHISHCGEGKSEFAVHDRKVADQRTLTLDVKRMDARFSPGADRDGKVVFEKRQKLVQYTGPSPTADPNETKEKLPNSWMYNEREFQEL